MQLYGTTEELYGGKYSHLDWWECSFPMHGFVGWDFDRQEETNGFEFLRKYLLVKFPTASWRESKGVQGYQWFHHLEVGSREICCIAHGGYQDLARVETSGSQTESIRDLFMEILPETGCKVPRIDSAFDSLSGTGEFNRVASWLENRAKQAGINCQWIINTDPNKGNTLYVGSRKSRVQIRLYEKGKQTGYRAGDWWRAEVQYRPRSTEKESVYKWTSGRVWGVSRVTVDLWEYLGGERLVAPKIDYVPPEKDLEYRTLHLLHQYGNLLGELLAVHGTGNNMISYFDALMVSHEKPKLSDRFSPVPHCPF